MNDLAMQAARYISGGLYWDGTQEGGMYWAEVHERLAAYGRGETVNRFPLARNVMDSPIRNAQADVGILKEAVQRVDDAFIWANSIEGWDYWNTVSSLLIKYIGVPPPPSLSIKERRRRCGYTDTVVPLPFPDKRVTDDDR